ncbi:rhamnan synthesis F family protein [Microbacterium awajiense]|uniref:rhamnan synthesis F family protein n=1 Tax=Microbacterium awajiense TaxID=415214 RepID=UPI0031E048D1
MTTRSPLTTAVLAHWDPDGKIAPHVERTVDALTSVADSVIVVSSAPLKQSSRLWLSTRTELIERENTGHDFASYREGIDRIDQATERLLVLNDSAVMPLVPMRVILDAMKGHRGVWGLTPGYGFTPHIQSYFVAFEVDALRSATFTSFWNSDKRATSRDDVIVGREVGLARTFGAAGFRLDTYYRPTIPARLGGAARAHQAALASALAERRLRSVAGWVGRLPRRASRPEWNPSAALADVALCQPRALPAVKLSVLRDDPYRLGSAGLLTALEQQHPHEFEGVREYLERTDRAYGDRWSTTRNARPSLLRYRGT